MNRYMARYFHPDWICVHAMTIEAESQEAAEQEAKRRSDDGEPLGWVERENERVPWQPGIRLVGVHYVGPKKLSENAHSGSRNSGKQGGCDRSQILSKEPADDSKIPL